MRVTLRFLQAIVCQIVSAVNTGLQVLLSVGEGPRRKNCRTALRQAKCGLELGELHR